MCITIYLDDIGIDTVEEFNEHLGFENLVFQSPEQEETARIHPHTCLCGIDVDKTSERLRLTMHMELFPLKNAPGNYDVLPKEN